MEQTTAPPSGQSTGEQMQDKAKDVAGQAQEKAQETAQQAKGQLRTQVDQRSSQAGEKVTGTASDIRSVADTLREQGKDQPAKLAEQAADRAERLGSYLSESNADRILNDVESAARRQPWAVAVGGALLGFAASRFLKASSRERYDQGTPGTSAHAPVGARPSNGSGTFAPAPAPVAQAPVPASQPAFDRLVPTDQVVPGADRSDPAGRRDRRGHPWQRPGRPLVRAIDNNDGPALKEPSIGELLTQLSQETTTLVRQELELAKAELTEKGKEAGKGAGMFGGPACWACSPPAR